MRMRKGALSLIVLSIIGLIIFTTTPMISAKERVQGSDASGSWDILITLKVSFLGFSKLVEEGEQYESDYYYEENWSPATWIFYGKNFPIRIIILTLVSLVFSLIAGLFSLFGYNTQRRLIGSITGLISGGLIITGELLFMDWGGYFIDMFSLTFTYRNYSFGFIVPVIVGSLTIIISIIFLIVKPKTVEKTLLKTQETSKKRTRKTTEKEPKNNTA
ncbi:MAG: hypothetical protein HGN29_17815 [Asgard group archaeon]|nr:hypothetical protein [Asgard group archaeon]